jgi:hypothetical protein
MYKKGQRGLTKREKIAIKNNGPSHRDPDLSVGSRVISTQCFDFSSEPLKLGRPDYFRRERFFGRFGQLIKSIFAAIAVSFDLSLLPIH